MIYKEFTFLDAEREARRLEETMADNNSYERWVYATALRIKRPSEWRKITHGTVRMVN